MLLLQLALMTDNASRFLSMHQQRTSLVCYFAETVYMMCDAGCGVCSIDVVV